MSRDRDPYRTNDRRVIPWLLLGLVLLFGGVYLAAYAVTGDRVPRGATVAGVHIGGMEPAGARAALATQSTPRDLIELPAGLLALRHPLPPDMLDLLLAMLRQHAPQLPRPIRPTIRPARAPCPKGCAQRRRRSFRLTIPSQTRRNWSCR